MTAMRSHSARSSGKYELTMSTACASRDRRTHQLVDQLVDLCLAGDIDAARRLVEHEHIHVVVKQARERDFLLVAARQTRHLLRRTRRRGYRGARSTAERSARCREGDTKKPRAGPSSRVIVMLSAMFRFVASPSPVRSSLSMPMPRRHQSAGVDGPRCTPSFTAPCVTASRPNSPRSSRVRPAPSKSGNAENLAAMQRERRRTQPLGREPVRARSIGSPICARHRADTAPPARVRPSD